MKQLCFPFIIIFCSICVNAQIQDIYEVGDYFVDGMAIYENNLFISQSEIGEIHRINLEDIDAGFEVFLDGIDAPGELKIRYNNLCFTNGETINYINLENQSSSPISFQFGTSIRDFVFWGYNIIYLDGESIFIYFPPLYVGLPLISELIETPEGITSMAMKEDVLYVSTYVDSSPEEEMQILKLDFSSDIAEWVLVSNLDEIPYDINFNGEDLYINYGQAAVGQALITKIDTSLDNAQNETIINEIENNFEGLIYNNQLYFFRSPGWISVLNLSALSTNELSNEKISLHPNPAQEFILISGLEFHCDYTIYNSLGSRVKQGTIKEGAINISKLNNGIFFILLDNGNSLRFIKN